jgi:hypothetical protein
MKVRDMSQLMMVDQLLPFTARSTNTVEQTVFEQLFVPDKTDRGAQMRLLAERFSRSLLAFLAPLVALFAVSLTNRLTNWFALPLACLGLMSVNLLCECGRGLAAGAAVVCGGGRIVFPGYRHPP